MTIRFEISGWAAYAPGLSSRGAWECWARSSAPMDGDLVAPLPLMAPMLRRRLSALGRAATQAAWDTHKDAAGIPVVLASRHGDCERTLRLIGDAARGEMMSPTDFTLSVHNAIGAVYSIARQDKTSYTSIAAGAASVACGVVEAAALLADGAPEVLLVCYDMPLPGEYAEFSDEDSTVYAWAWRIVPAVQGGPHLSLEWMPEASKGGDGTKPEQFGLQAHRFAISDAPELVQMRDGIRWTWSRHD